MASVSWTKSRQLKPLPVCVPWCWCPQTPVRRAAQRGATLKSECVEDQRQAGRHRLDGGGQRRTAARLLELVRAVRQRRAWHVTPACPLTSGVAAGGPGWRWPGCSAEDWMQALFDVAVALGWQVHRENGRPPVLRHTAGAPALTANERHIPPPRARCPL
jgi:hypothetical protein